MVKKDTIVTGTREFSVHPLPDPEPHIYGYKSGHIPKKFLLAADGVIARLTNSSFSFHVQVMEYTVIAMRDSSIIGTSRNMGPRYNKQTASLIEKLQVKDKLIVCGIIVRYPQQKRLIQPMEFVVVEE